MALRQRGDQLVDNPFETAYEVVQVLSDLRIPYVVVGSFESIIHGVIRTTVDADLVVELTESDIQHLVERLKGEYYIDDEMIADAIHRRSSFSLIHLESNFKVDIFISKERPFEKSRFERRQPKPLGKDTDLVAFISSAEDTILAKLEWYRLGDEVSSRQWEDVLGIIKVQGERLDQAYLRKWAPELGVADLLERAMVEAA